MWLVVYDERLMVLVDVVSAERAAVEVMMYKGLLLYEMHMIMIGPTEDAVDG